MAEGGRVELNYLRCGGMGDSWKVLFLRAVKPVLARFIFEAKIAACANNVWIPLSGSRNVAIG